MPDRHLRLRQALSAFGVALFAFCACPQASRGDDRLAARERYVRKLCTTVHSSARALARRATHPSTKVELAWGLSWWELPKLIGAEELQGTPVDPIQYKDLILKSWLNNLSNFGERDVTSSRESFSKILDTEIRDGRISTYKIHLQSTEKLGDTDLIQIDEYRFSKRKNNKYRKSPLGFYRNFVILSSSSVPAAAGMPVDTDMNVSLVNYSGHTYFIGDSFDIGPLLYVEANDGIPARVILGDVCVRGRLDPPW